MVLSLLSEKKFSCVKDYPFWKLQPFRLLLSQEWSIQKLFLTLHILLGTVLRSYMYKIHCDIFNQCRIKLNMRYRSWYNCKILCFQFYFDLTSSCRDTSTELSFSPSAYTISFYKFPLISAHFLLESNIFNKSCSISKFLFVSTIYFDTTNLCFVYIINMDTRFVLLFIVSQILQKLF